MTPPSSAPSVRAPAGPSRDTRSRGPVARRGVLAVAVIALVALAVALPLARGGGGPAPLDPAALVPAVGSAEITSELAGQLEPAPPAGTATLLPGPLTGRVAVGALALEAGERPAVTGTVQVTTDVSTLIVMELRAGFYDAGGRLVSSERVVLRQPDFTRAFEAGLTTSQYGGALPFRIEAPPEGSAGVSSAVLSVPVVVNE